MFVISAYNLHTGEELYHQECEKIETALSTYQLIVPHYRNLRADDCFGVMLYTESGNIIYGFGEE